AMAATDIDPLSLHDALPIWLPTVWVRHSYDIVSSGKFPQNRRPFPGSSDGAFPMELLTAGLNHTTASVALRERLSFSGAALEDALRDVREQPGVEIGRASCRERV